MNSGSRGREVGGLAGRGRCEETSPLGKLRTSIQTLPSAAACGAGAAVSTQGPRCPHGAHTVVPSLPASGPVLFLSFPAGPSQALLGSPLSLELGVFLLPQDLSSCDLLALSQLLGPLLSACSSSQKQQLNLF